MKPNNFVKLLVSIIVCELAGLIGSIFTMPAIPTWYAGLQKAALNPPSWVFGPVWTTLFALMGIAFFIVWKNRTNKNKAAVKTAFAIFAGQLLMNILWSILFFGLQSPGSALLEVIGFWLMILVTIIAFSKVSKAAAWLLLPYILWVSFATYLNYAVWMLN